MELTQEYFDQQLSTLARKEDIEAIKSDVSELKTDVTGLKTGIQSVKTDIVALQDDFRSMKTDISEISQTLTALNKRDKEDSDALAKTLVKQDERLNIVEQDLKNLKLRQA